MASWQTTVKRISELHLSIDEYFNRLNADIVCLQEVKINQRKIEGYEGAFLGTRLDDFESFWAISTDKDSVGFQGVTTFVRKGLTIRASSNPFNDPYLNSLGRCIVTEHETFVLFNVYVINSGEDQRLNFYRQLFDAISDYRKRYKKNIILAGDLNLTLSPLDRHFTLRKIELEKICMLSLEDINPTLVPIMRAIRNSWPVFLEALKGKAASKQITYSKALRKERERYALKVTYNNDRIRIGQLFDTSEQCLAQFQHCESLNMALVQDLQEVLNLEGKTFKNKVWKLFSDTYGVVLTESSVWKLVTTYLESEKMVDVHRFFNPNMDFRYTCWRQDKNMRYSNIGGKIDYLIVDESMVNRVDGKYFKMDCSEEGSQRAVTENNQFIPASFEGGGLQVFNQDLLMNHIKPSDSGFVYTPPTFSDHIALSVRLHNFSTKKHVLDRNCKETRITQPFKKQKTINQFFKRRKLG